MNLVVILVDKVLLIYDYVMHVHVIDHHLYVCICVPGNIHLWMSYISVTSQQLDTSCSNTAQIFVLLCQIPNAPLTRCHHGIYTINGCPLPPIMSYMCFKCIITTFEIIWFCFISHILWQIFMDAKIGHYPFMICHLQQFVLRICCWYRPSHRMFYGRIFKNRKEIFIIKWDFLMWYA